MAALPFLPQVPIKGTSAKPKPYAEFPQTIGEHIKRARLMRGLTQAQAGVALGVSAFTVLDWEKGYTEPAVPFTPAIRTFLGYDISEARHATGVNARKATSDGAV